MGLLRCPWLTFPYLILTYPIHGSQTINYEGFWLSSSFINYSETSQQRTCLEQQTKCLVPNVAIFVKLPPNSGKILIRNNFLKTRRCPLFRGFTVFNYQFIQVCVLVHVCVYSDDLNLKYQGRHFYSDLMFFLYLKILFYSFQIKPQCHKFFELSLVTTITVLKPVSFDNVVSLIMMSHNSFVFKGLLFLARSVAFLFNKICLRVTQTGF